MSTIKAYLNKILKPELERMCKGYTIHEEGMSAPNMRKALGDVMLPSDIVPAQAPARAPAEAGMCGITTTLSTTLSTLGRFTNHLTYTFRYLVLPSDCLTPGQVSDRQRSRTGLINWQANPHLPYLRATLFP
jgi:hypothetical protein